LGPVVSFGLSHDTVELSEFHAWSRREQQLSVERSGVCQPGQLYSGRYDSVELHAGLHKLHTGNNQLQSAQHACVSIAGSAVQFFAV
jgi:X-X-X-Leu-X-X-Gly heptad repeat protein